MYKTKFTINSCYFMASLCVLRMLKLLQKKREEKYLLDSVLRWAKKNKSEDGTNTLFFFTKNGDLFSLYADKRATQHVGLIIAEKTVIHDAFQSLSIALDKNQWKKIGETRMFEIWEKDVSNNNKRYIRLGVNDKERDSLLLFARTSISLFLNEQSDSSFSKPSDNNKVEVSGSSYSNSFSFLLSKNKDRKSVV